MKNLKKVLSLALAFAMVLGLCIGASAAQDVTTLTDWNEVENKDAATLLGAFEIMKGDTDGNFRPNDNVTRAETAKMISVALWGGSDDVSLYNAGNIGGYTDVVAGSWYMGYVNYMTVQSIVTGKGEGIFDPNGNVTGYELLKMCLVSLGYSPETEGMTGAGWDVRTMALATKPGFQNLTAKTSVTNWNAPLTRTNAAQIIANMIYRETVIYSLTSGVGGNATSRVTGTGNTFAEAVLGMTQRTGKIVANEYGTTDKAQTIDKDGKGYNNENTILYFKAVTETVGDKTNTIAEELTAKVEMTSTAADVGATVKAFVVGKTVVSATIVNPTEVTPKFGADGKITNLDKDMLKETNPEALNVSINGAKDNGAETPVAYTEATLTTDGATHIYKVTNKTMSVDPNAEVKFYDTDNDGYIDTVKAFKYTLAKVEKDDGKNKAGDELYKLGTTDVTKASCDFEAKKGDYVAVAPMPDGNVFSVDAKSNHGYVLSTVEGKVNRTSAAVDNVSSTIYIDGVKYSNVAAGLGVNSEGIFHLYADGTVAACTGTAVAAAPTYAVIYGGAANEIKGGSLTTGGSSFDTKVAAILEDGTVGEYTLAAVKVSYTNDKSESKTVTIDATKIDVIAGSGTMDKPSDVTTDPSIAKAQLPNVGSNKNYIATYTLDGNKITITDPVEINPTTGGTNLNASDFDGKVTVSGQTITSKTVGFVQTAADGEHEAWAVVKGVELAKKVNPKDKTTPANPSDVKITYVAGDLFVQGDGDAVAYMVIPNAAVAAGEGKTADLYYILSDPETFKEGNDTMWAAKVFNGSTGKVEEMTWKATAAGVSKGEAYTTFKTTGFDDPVTGTTTGFVANVVDDLLNVVKYKQTESDGTITSEAVTGAPFTVDKDTKYYLIDGDDSKVITKSDLAAQDVIASVTNTDTGKTTTYYQVEVKLGTDSRSTIVDMVIVYANPQSVTA